MGGGTPFLGTPKLHKEGKKVKSVGVNARRCSKSFIRPDMNTVSDGIGT